MPRTIYIDPADLGPRNARKGERMTPSWNNGYAELYEFDGQRWVRTATYNPRLYPKCWTLADGTRQAEHP